MNIIPVPHAVDAGDGRVLITADGADTAMISVLGRARRFLPIPPRIERHHASRKEVSANRPIPAVCTIPVMTTSSRQARLYTRRVRKSGVSVRTPDVVEFPGADNVPIAVMNQAMHPINFYLSGEGATS